MELLSLSTPLSSHSLSTLKPKPISSPSISFTLIKSSQQTASKPTTPNALSFKTTKPKPTLHFTASTPPSQATRGGDTDTMALLLKERIVFLGSQIDDFVADSIISQLLLLDAQDPSKDIRFFVNSVGGSLRLFATSADCQHLRLPCNSCTKLLAAIYMLLHRFLATNAKRLNLQPLQLSKNELETYKIAVGNHKEKARG